MRFGRPERAYPHFTALALRTGLATVFRDIPTPSLAIWSDERTGAVGRARRLAGELSFAAALRQAFAEDEARPAHSNPPVTLDNAYIQTLGSARSGSAFTLEQEMLQLTDLLLGAAATAIDPRTTAATKRHFAREMALVMEDVRMAPRRRSFGLHDHFLASYFPGPHGSLTSDGPIGVRAE